MFFYRQKCTTTEHCIFAVSFVTEKMQAQSKLAKKLYYLFIFFPPEKLRANWFRILSRGYTRRYFEIE